MSTAEVIQQLHRMDNQERLAVIETATRLIRQDLNSNPGLDERMRSKAMELRDLYRSLSG